MVLALVLSAWLAMPSAAKASCGYYLIIGRPSAEAAEQMKLRQESMPLEHKKIPQCRRHDRPMNPANIITILSHDAMALAISKEDRAETSSQISLDQCSFISEPHIWRVDPPPRA